MQPFGKHQLGGYAGEAEWCPEASSRGDAKQPKQPRRCAGRQAGAHRRGEDSPLTRSADLAEFASEFLLELELCQRISGRHPRPSSPEASSRGDAKQPKQPGRCAGRQAGAHRGSEAVAPL
jgi:hypothetical protein